MYKSNKPYGKSQFQRLIKWSIQVIRSSYFFKTDIRNWTETKLITQMVAYQPWNGNSLLLIQLWFGANDLGVKSYQSHDEFIEPLFDVPVGKKKSSVSNKIQWKTLSTLICYLPLPPWLMLSARKPGPVSNLCAHILTAVTTLELLFQV